MKQNINSISERIISFARNILDKQKTIKDKLSTISKVGAVANDSLTLDEMINRMAISGSCETIKGLADVLSRSVNNVSKTDTKQFRVYLNSIITICAIAEEAIDRLEVALKENDETNNHSDSN